MYCPGVVVRKIVWFDDTVVVVEVRAEDAEGAAVIVREVVAQVLGVDVVICANPFLIECLVKVAVEVPDVEVFLVMVGDSSNMGSSGSGWNYRLSAWFHWLHERYCNEGSISCGGYCLIYMAMGSVTELGGN